jgi:thiol-disulfide isomerase/thioredoxin
MRRQFASLALIAILLLSAGPAAAALPAPGDTVADLEIKTPPQPSEAAYLGLSARATSFRLSQIKAELLLVDIYSMYCPRCQAEAPAVNRLFGLLKSEPAARGIRFIGIAAGNSPFEVEVFRKKYQAAQPLFPDAEYVLHKGLGSVGTPSYLLLRSLPGGRGFRVLLSREGEFKDEAAFLQQVLGAAAKR